MSQESTLISFRLRPAERAKFDSLQERSGLSRPELFRELLRLAEIEMVATVAPRLILSQTQKEIQDNGEKG